MKNVTCRILGLNISVTNMVDTVETLIKNIEYLRGKYICVSNVHTTVMSYKDKSYANVQNNAAFILPDGKPLSVVSRLYGYREAQRVAGPDLMLELMAASTKYNYGHYLYGTTEDTLNKLKAELLELYPTLNIVGMYAPPFRELTVEEDNKIVNQINSVKPDFVWVALGAPKQERWMFEHQGKVNAVMIGVGAAFDFHAKTIKRAPKWVQNIGFEWFYRMSQDPKRLVKRYLTTNFVFLYEVIKERMARCFKSRE